MPYAGRVERTYNCCRHDLPSMFDYFQGKMTESTVTILVIAFLSLLAVFVTAASILILFGGKFYHKIPSVGPVGFHP